MSLSMRTLAVAVYLTVLLGLAGAGERSAFPAEPQAAEPQPIADIVERASSAVVYIESETGCGSGFVVCTTPNIDIMTNHHVMGDSRTFTVSFFLKGADGKTRAVEVEDVRAYFAFPRLDFGVIRIPQNHPSYAGLARDVKPIRSGDSTKLRLGERVAVIGSPGAGMVTLGNSISDGIVSGLNRQINGLPYVQTTAPINFGNSGGPVLNMRGEAVGIVTLKAIFNENIAFALPMHMTDQRNYEYYLPENLKEPTQRLLQSAVELAGKGRFDEALAECRKAAVEEPAKARPLIVEASVLDDAKKLDESIEVYGKALKCAAIRYDDFMFCILELGKLHGRRNEGEKAIATFKMGLECDAWHDGLNRNIGVAYANSGRKTKALAHWWLSLLANPDQPDLEKMIDQLLGRRSRVQWWLW